MQHIACEPPGVYEDVLRERGATIRRVEMDEGESLPEPGEFDAIVAMGGPMGVYEDARHPWLGRPSPGIAREHHAARGRPMIRTIPRQDLVPSGREPCQLDRVLVRLGAAFDLPDGAVRLAGSPAYANQAFRVGGAAYGVQFHLEVSPELAREWASVPAYAEALERVLGPGALDDLISRLEEHAGRILSYGRQVFARWLDVAVPAAVR